MNKNIQNWTKTDKKWTKIDKNRQDRGVCLFLVIIGLFPMILEQPAFFHYTREEKRGGGNN